MKKFLNLLYERPVLFSILINLISSMITIVAINKENYYLLIPSVIALILNRKITENGINLTKRRQVLIFMSFFGMITFTFLCNKQIDFFKYFK
ncbi:hypothetical protein ACQPU1_08590 [Clostridium paraputrificum]|uniref:hypothetical protein n=1 Tax=Clostridium TaxID=1485 RepID=UPI003D351EAF